MLFFFSFLLLPLRYASIGSAESSVDQTGVWGCLLYPPAHLNSTGDVARVLPEPTLAVQVVSTMQSTYRGTCTICTTCSVPFVLTWGLFPVSGIVGSLRYVTESGSIYQGIYLGRLFYCGTRVPRYLHNKVRIRYGFRMTTPGRLHVFEIKPHGLTFVPGAQTL